jgi:hypothetical protein
MGEIAYTPSFLSDFQTYYTGSNNDCYMKAWDMYKKLSVYFNLVSKLLYRLQPVIDVKFN